MVEGEFGDFETQDLCEKYPEYDDMDYGQFDYEYNHTQDLLIDDQKIENDEEKREYTKRSEYLLKLIHEKQNDPTFLERYRGKTVNIEKNSFEDTSWIDDDINYQQDDKRVIG